MVQNEQSIKLLIGTLVFPDSVKLTLIIISNNRSNSGLYQLATIHNGFVVFGGGGGAGGGDSGGGGCAGGVGNSSHCS